MIFITKKLLQAVYFRHVISKLNFKLIHMKKNMGSFDKIFRFIVALVFVVLYFTNTVTGIWGIVLLILAAVFVLTSFISFCPLYVPFGINTCKTKSK